MKKNVILNIISLLLILYLTGCNNHTSVNTETTDISQNVIITEPSVIPTKQTPTIMPPIVPTNPTSKSYLPDSTAQWNPNHGIANITYKKVGKYDDCNEYVFISPTEGWKAYIGPIGAGQDFIVLYKSNDGGKHWDKIYEPPMGGGDIVFLNSKVGWILHDYPMNGVVILSKTLDGGITWEKQQINTPSEYSDIDFGAGMPVFFSKKDGIMFASCEDSTNNYENVGSVAFITHDGGETWRLNTKDNIDKIFTWSVTVKKDTISDFEITYDKEIWHSTNNLKWEKLSDK